MGIFKGSFASLRRSKKVKDRSVKKTMRNLLMIALILGILTICFSIYILVNEAIESNVVCPEPAASIEMKTTQEKPDGLKKL